MNSQVYYTTKTGIQIGCNYQPKPKWETFHDMLELQDALLKYENKPKSPVLRKLRNFFPFAFA